MFAPFILDANADQKLRDAIRLTHAYTSADESGQVHFECEMPRMVLDTARFADVHGVVNFERLCGAYAEAR